MVAGDSDSDRPDRTKTAYVSGGAGLRGIWVSGKREK